MQTPPKALETSGHSCYFLIVGEFILESFNYHGYGMSKDNTGKMVIDRDGVALQFIFPGLTGQQGTVSLELVASPGTYITHQEGRLTAGTIEAANQG